MKSFCIKTNNNAILEYLLEKLDYLELEEVKYSKNKFKIIWLVWTNGNKG